MFIDREEFAKYATQALINTDKLTEEEAKEEIDMKFTSWDKTKLDARDIHELITLAFLHRNLINGDSWNDFVRKYVEPNVPNLWNKIKDDPNSESILLTFLNTIEQKINT